MLKKAETPEEEEEVESSLSLYPLTGEVVAIGMLDAESLRGGMYYQVPHSKTEDQATLPLEEDGIVYESFGGEAGLLEKFWEVVKGFDTIVTYNGRGFDCPYLLVRSAIHNIKPTFELMPNRYAPGGHIDLMDRLIFYGSVRRRFSLDMWCRAFGIKSPKEEVSGAQVPEMFRAGKYLEIARYCARDLFATRELLLHWEQYMQFKK